MSTPEDADEQDARVVRAIALVAAAIVYHSPEAAAALMRDDISHRDQVLLATAATFEKFIREGQK